MKTKSREPAYSHPRNQNIIDGYAAGQDPESGKVKGLWRLVFGVCDREAGMGKRINHDRICWRTAFPVL